MIKFVWGILAAIFGAMAIAALQSGQWQNGAAFSLTAVLTSLWQIQATVSEKRS